MNKILNLFSNPVFVMALYWVYSAAVTSMPEPMPNGNQFYKWFYSFLHLLAGNIDKLAALKAIK